LPLGSRAALAVIGGVEPKDEVEARPMQKRGRISNKALDKRLGAMERVEAKEHRYGGKDQQGINASTR
jgi:hypothetical protein